MDKKLLVTDQPKTRKEIAASLNISVRRLFMKKIIFLWLFIRVFTLSGQNEKADYVVYYSFTWVTDTVKEQYAPPEKYELYHIDGVSKFLNSRAYYNDSIDYAFQEGSHGQVNTQESLDQYMRTEQPKTKRFTSALRVLKDFDNKSSKIILYGTWNRHYLQEPLALDWALLPGVENIRGIHCQKATTTHGGRTYTAWYAPQIPISDGPYIFHGLPGLITRVEDSDGFFLFELTDYQVNPQRSFYQYPFITQDYPQEIDRATYVANSRKEKENPSFSYLVPYLTPEQLAKKKKQRKTRFDLLIEN